MVYYPIGVNVTDHDLTLRSLTEVLQNNVTPYVISLQAKECPGKTSALSTVMRCCRPSPPVSVSRFHCPFSSAGTAWRRTSGRMRFLVPHRVTLTLQEPWPLLLSLFCPHPYHISFTISDSSGTSQGVLLKPVKF